MLSFDISKAFNDNTFNTLLIFVSIDIVTGYYKAIKQRNINSKVGMLGLIRHFVIIFIAIALFVLSNIHKVPDIFTGGTVLFISTYAISITENLNDMGVPVPDFITKFIQKKGE